jgi:hypothetical protein
MPRACDVCGGVPVPIGDRLTFSKAVNAKASLVVRLDVAVHDQPEGQRPTIALCDNCIGGIAGMIVEKLQPVPAPAAKPSPAPTK